MANPTIFISKFEKKHNLINSSFLISDDFNSPTKPWPCSPSRVTTPTTTTTSTPPHPTCRHRRPPRWKSRPTTSSSWARKSLAASAARTTLSPSSNTLWVRRRACRRSKWRCKWVRRGSESYPFTTGRRRGWCRWRGREVATSTSFRITPSPASSKRPRPTTTSCPVSYSFTILIRGVPYMCIVTGEKNFHEKN